MTGTGDTPHTGKDARLVDVSGQEVVEPGGDSPRTDPEPALVEEADVRPPTAGELRKAGYQVPEGIKAGDVPSSYVADSPTPPGEVRLVEDTTPQASDKSPTEIFSALAPKASAPKGSPENK